MKCMKRTFALIALSILIIAATFSGCGTNEIQAPENLYQEQYDLGIRYLSEGNYEEAIIAFEAAIEIEPKSIDAYIGLADAYVAAGDVPAAIAVLRSAPEEVQTNQTVEDKLEEVKTETITHDDGSYSVVEYDENGYMVKQMIYNSDGTLWLISEYGENRKEIKTTYYSPDGKVSQVDEYDENRNVVKHTSYVDGVVYAWEISEYDENGNEIKTTYYFPDGTVSSWSIHEYEYNENGRTVKTTYYSSDGTTNSWAIHEYDENENYIRVTTYVDGIVVSILERDESGAFVEQIS